MSHYLARLVTEATTVINAPDYGRTIKDHATRRTLLSIADEVRAQVYSPSPDRGVTEIIAEAEQAIFALANEGERRERMRGLDAALTEALQMAAEAYSRDGGLSGLATGISDLDRYMGGLQASDLIVLAARPGMGKSALATNIAWRVAESGVGVGLYSLEMSGEQLATRIVAERSGIPSSVIRRGEISERQFGTLSDTADLLRQLPLYIEDAGDLNIAQVAASARRLCRRHSIGLIIVDYIQLMSGTTRRSSENRVSEITEITTKLKALAKELGVPVLALSQLSRQVESRDDKRPTLSDLRDSGSIEQDADVVLFIYRDEYYLRNREPKEGTPKHIEWQAEMEAAHGKAEIIVAKQRHGPTGSVEVAFNAALTSFGNLARAERLPERWGDAA